MFHLTVAFRIAELQRDKVVKIRTTTSSIPIEGALFFEEVPAGTKLTASDSVLTRPYYLRPFEALLTRIMEKETRIVLQKLKTIIEAMP